MVRTTVVADEPLMIEVKRLARSQGRSVSELVRDALGEYVDRNRGSQYLSFIGIADGGGGNIAERAEEILAEGMGEED